MVANKPKSSKNLTQNNAVEGKQKSKVLVLEQNAATAVGFLGISN